MMSLIEQALQKLQARSQNPARSPTQRVASVVRPDDTYSGHRLVVDPVQLKAQGLLAPDQHQRRLAEQYRTIKRPLLSNADPRRDPPVERGNLLMVASALQGEGKTFTCINLCLSIARERDWSVVLVDADCAKPQLTRLFAADNQRGLIDLLRDPSLRFDDLVMPTDVAGLSLLPAGAHDAHASELLASNRMDQLCRELSAQGGRIIVFDSSPLLLTTEAPVLASKVGQIVVVVKANETPQHAVLAAVEKLDPNKAVSCVLNQSWDGAELVPTYGYYGYAEPPPET
jgi:exopolysaccharide/PEP-CTERM locus tyrosine autokinase